MPRPGLQRPAQVRRLMASIDADGQRVPLAVVGGGERFVLVDGYQRWEALKAPGPRYRPGRGVGRSRFCSPGAGLGSPSGAHVRAHRAGLAAVGSPERGNEPAYAGCRPGQGPQLGQPAPGAAVAVVRSDAGGGAPGRALDLGGQPGVRTVGARQRRRCRGTARCPAHRAAVDPGVDHLVCPLWTG